MSISANPARERSLWNRLRRAIFPRGLFGRALLILIVPLLVLQLVITYVFIQRHVDGITRQMTENVAQDLNGFARLVESQSDPVAIDAMLARLSEGLGYDVEFVSGGRISPHPELPFYKLAQRAIGETLQSGMDYPISVDTQSLRKAIEVDVQLPDGVLRARPLERYMTVSNPHFLLVWMVAVSLLLLVIAVLFLRNQVRPIRQLARAAEAFGKGQPAPLFKPSGAEEVRRAASAFLTMRGRIERQIAQRTLMLSGVSHDLRTPLTRMKLALAMLDDPVEAEDLLRDVKQMERMVDGFLAFAKGEETEATRIVDIEDVTREAIAQARTRKLPIDFDVNIGDSGSLRMNLRADAIRRAVTNIVENAAKYGTRIWVTLISDPTHVKIVIEDDGPGLPESERRDAMRPFYRGDAARNQDSGSGSGLGLSIALDAARSHGGDVVLSDSPHGGLKAVISLPR